MIQMGTLLNVADNTGVKKVQCVKVLGGSKKMSARIGDKIVVSVRQAAPNTKIKEGQTVRAIIIRTRKETKRKDGFVIKFFDNSVVLIDNNGEIIGTRVFGVIPREIRSSNMKIISLAEEVS